MPDIDFHKLDKTKVYVPDMCFPRKLLLEYCIISPANIFLKWYNIFDNFTQFLDNAELEKQVRIFNEHLVINPEEIIFARYLLHFKNLENVSYFKADFS